MSDFSHPARSVLVTGGTDGIGFALARRLVDDGATVLLHARDQASGDRAVEDLVKAGVEPLRLRLVVADFTRLGEVAALAEQVARTVTGLDVLVNNAAIAGPERRTITEDGHEVTLQVNYLAPVLLATVLAPVLASVSGRMVNLTSRTHRGGAIGWNDLARRNFYLPLPMYAQSKLALTMFTRDYADKHHGELTAVSVHPGAVDTRMLRVYGRQGMSAQDAADIVADLCPPERSIVNGGYYDGRDIAAPAALVDNATARARLARLTAELLGID
ncbi:SDR family NAD(P)-dependent oxidoreductase [Nocardia uniformis]|uniref:SDR family NAD(P)-dependent oxidoreductase n=1 Tax=Nocardia uniformis TaxID=53432 RepID=A0A849BXH5_9NOCA|nr:SDR family NAD(P)-dependent oxidoreductase [Nocardia uniformis]NNH68397.1 SDR family NAD(P)-dependent oxidoreductase [Nocardia uniformis]